MGCDNERGPVALWDGEPDRTSIEHDTIYDKPQLRAA